MRSSDIVEQTNETPAFAHVRFIIKRKIRISEQIESRLLTNAPWKCLRATTVLNKFDLQDKHLSSFNLKSFSAHLTKQIEEKNPPNTRRYLLEVCLKKTPARIRSCSEKCDERAKHRDHR